MKTVNLLCVRHCERTGDMGTEREHIGQLSGANSNCLAFCLITGLLFKRGFNCAPQSKQTAANRVPPRNAV